jgi:hypothetical protein
MPLAQASYPGGTYRTDVSDVPGVDVAGGAPGGEGGGWLWDLAKRSAEAKLRKAALEERQMLLDEKAKRMALKEAGRPAPRQRQPSLREQNALMAEQTAREEEANTKAETARQMRGTGPRRYIFGLGYAGGPNQTTADTSRMTGIQRQIFLAQAAGLQGGPSRMEEEGAAGDKIGSEIWGRRMLGTPSAAQEYANISNRKA